MLICWTCFWTNPNPLLECTCSYGMNNIEVKKETFEAIHLLLKKWFKITINTKWFPTIID